ncbi:MAG: M48 family metallopeptidase [Jatrophihabitans sp.]|uniref:M48 family metallopeptidase n=1 Tax=Jatrophihabitans sp. TaxID=1932789 RepID=UPI003916913F
MNFFERQRTARSTTVRLVVLFVLAVVSIVAVNDAVVLYLVRQGPTSTIVGALVAMSVFTLLIIGGGTASKLIALRAGGAAVAQSVGAVAVDPSTTDPRLRRFVNVVEEMSIASGIPMPRLFVLEQEPGINAFAAGFSPADAAITATSGALDRLNRDELQGVIGHEFSHVLNGDMRLNVRLIGLLNGILLLGLVGLRFLQFGGGRSRNSKGSPLLFIAIALVVLGFVGQFFAGLIKAAVSRQREWLADASSVQFTRQTTGLAGALKKIAGLPDGSALTDRHGAKQVSHMLFGEGSRRLSSMYATHPPLLERIAALDPTTTPQQLAELEKEFADQPPDGLAEDASLGLVGAGVAPPAARPAPPRPDATVRVDPEGVSARVRSVTAEDLTRGARLSARIPPPLRAAASQASAAVPLILAMLVDTRPAVRDVQLRIIGNRLGQPVAAAAATQASALAGVEPVLRLPIAQLALPQLTARPVGERTALRTTLDELARAGATITVFEYCLGKVVGGYLLDAESPRDRSRPGRAPVRAVEDAAVTLLAVVAAAGNADAAAAGHAFAAAASRLLPGRQVPFAPPADPWAALDAGWDPLNTLDPRNKQVLVEALVAAVSDDGVLTAGEAELLRAACTVLRCPLPPLVA